MDGCIAGYRHIAGRCMWMGALPDIGTFLAGVCGWVNCWIIIGTLVCSWGHAVASPVQILIHIRDTPVTTTYL